MVYLYVDDLLVTGNNAVMIEGFKQEMMHVFEMIDFRLMTYFIGMEVKQNKHLSVHLPEKSMIGKY